jgi:DNA-binding GntR family transcriptional regulator
VSGCFQYGLPFNAMELDDINPTNKNPLNEQVANALRTAIAEGKLGASDRVPGGDFSGLHHAGHSPTTIREEWSARMPDRVEAAALQLPPASPVLEFIRTIRDQDKRAVEVMLSLIAADATSLTYEFAVPD